MTERAKFTMPCTDETAPEDGSSTDVDRFKYGYDRASNRTWRENTGRLSLFHAAIATAPLLLAIIIAFLDRYWWKGSFAIKNSKHDDFEQDHS